MSTVTDPTPDDTEKTADSGQLAGASTARIIAVLAAIVLFTEVVPLQYFMVSVALQKMTSSFPNVGANINWTIIILGLVGASATPLLAKMADIWGKKRIFILCGLFFIVGCLIDALTHSWTWFLIGRGLQAFAIATQAISWALVRDLLPRKWVPIGLGVTATGMGFSGVLAPIVAGYLVDHYDWRMMFWVLGVFTLIMVPIVMIVVPESTRRVKDRIDPVGAVLLSVGVALTLIYLDKGQDWGWGRPTTFAWLIAGLALLVAFYVVEARISRPLVDVKLLSQPKVSLVLLMGLLGVGILAVQSYALGYMTQTPSQDQLHGIVSQGVVDKAHEMVGVNLPLSAVQLHFDPGYTYGDGFTLMQYALHIGIVAGLVGMIFGPLGGYLTTRVGGRIVAIMALAIMTGTGIGYALLPYSWTTYAILAAVFGIGFGFLYSSVPILVTEAVPPEQHAISSGMLGVTFSMGTSIGLAIVTALLNNSPVKAQINVMGNKFTQVIPQVFADRGYSLGFLVMSGFSFIALLIAVFMRHGRKPATGGIEAMTAGH
ncbi:MULTISPECIES: MFS transporter [Nocardia]|uniref:MFS transporter n=1 Tax=Nocardia vinacea TaxID=96468 RepID=A0ABZ1YQ32_9NOCA|nr:MFS transporter [Nocardia vinacea]